MIEVHTGLVLDLAVVSLYCQSCTHTKACHDGTNNAEYKTWKKQHTGWNGNYTGTSGGMEADAAETLWSRSVDRHKFRYTTLLSDGDSNTYKHLCALNVYGDVTVIVKEECINHMTKRLGTAVRKLFSQSKKWGRGWGKLTHPAIVKLKRQPNLV